MKIQIKHKEVYGVPLAYICDPTQAAAIATLTGTKTLLPRHITALKTLGFDVENLDETLKTLFAPVTKPLQSAHTGL